MIPSDFDAWQRCITVDCKIALDKPFVTERLKQLERRQNPETKKFIACYGEAHYQNIINWFKQV